MPHHQPHSNIRLQVPLILRALNPQVHPQAYRMRKLANKRGMISTEHGSKIHQFLLTWPSLSPLARRPTTWTCPARGPSNQGYLRSKRATSFQLRVRKLCTWSAKQSSKIYSTNHEPNSKLGGGKCERGGSESLIRSSTARIAAETSILTHVGPWSGLRATSIARQRSRTS